MINLSQYLKKKTKDTVVHVVLFTCINILLVNNLKSKNSITFTTTIGGNPLKTLEGYYFSIGPISQIHNIYWSFVWSLTDFLGG